MCSLQEYDAELNEHNTLLVRMDGVYAKCVSAHQQHIAIAHMPMSRRTCVPFKVYMCTIIVLYYSIATTEMRERRER